MAQHPGSAERRDGPASMSKTRLKVDHRVRAGRGAGATQRGSRAGLGDLEERTAVPAAMQRTFPIKMDTMAKPVGLAGGERTLPLTATSVRAAAAAAGAGAAGAEAPACLATAAVVVAAAAPFILVCSVANSMADTAGGGAMVGPPVTVPTA